MLQRQTPPSPPPHLGVWPDFILYEAEPFRPLQGQGRAYCTDRFSTMHILDSTEWVTGCATVQTPGEGPNSDEGTDTVLL
jgi:hypothetical protein